MVSVTVLKVVIGTKQNARGRAQTICTVVKHGVLFKFQVVSCTS